MIKRRVIRDLGAGPWMRLTKMRNGQILNLGLGGVYRKAKKMVGRKHAKAEV